MTKLISFLLFLMVIVSYQGCTGANYKKKILKKELKENINIPEQKICRPAIKIVEVSAEHFDMEDNIIPDREIIKRAKIMGAELGDVISLLTEATNQNIIFQLQSNNLKETSSSIKKSKIYMSASKVEFGRLLEKTVGDKLSIRFEDDTYYLGYTKTVTIKIPALKGLISSIKSELTTLGAANIIYNKVSSSVTFSAREKEYKDIMNYLKILRDNIYMIEYDIAIYNVELSDNYSLGIDWNILPKIDSKFQFNLNTNSNANSFINPGSTSANFGALLNLSDFNIDLLADTLSEFGKVESIQKPKLLGMAGTDVSLVDGLEEPYIKQLTTTTIGDTGIKTSSEAGVALSGLKITLNSNIMDGTVLTDISLQINDIVGYNNFTVDGNTYSQPRTVTKTIKNSMRVQPGVPIIISGLFRHKSNKGFKGLPGLDDTDFRLLAGSESKDSTKSEMVIVVTPRLIKYVMK